MKGAIALTLSLLAWSGVRGGPVGSAGNPEEESGPAMTAAVCAEDPAVPPPPGRGTLTKGFWGLSDELARHGIEVTLASTNVYQTNARGGLGTHQQAGRFTGSYDVEFATDIEKLLGLRGWGLLVHGWGGYPATPGINDTMVGSAFNVNWDAIGNPPLDVVEVILEGKPFEDLVALNVGKINFARVFDTSAYANDETSQFLNGAFINDPTIPIPDYCLGVILSANLTDWWSVAAGVGDAEADGRATGLGTTFDGDNYYFYAWETGLRANLRSPRGPLAGNYRLGLWYDTQPKTSSGGDEAYRNDVGVYASVDQMLLKENADPEDGQGLGIFARYGHADEKRYGITGFWSAGLQYQGLLRGRDDDVLGLGFALGRFRNEASAPGPDDDERVLEFYYAVRVVSWGTISPSVQYVTNPGGDSAGADALVVGVRALVAF